ncbi:MAG TPA: sigma-70 family RNA polymerase sigma factor [Candidatus Acidoferrales bacterium]|nr:sigma-70 family RNA polymerase sigma factor [Candidatus Acidoferrales bacterium]
MDKSREPFLIQRIRAGERSHFHELIRPYERRAFLIAYSVLRNQDDAEDAVQQAMLKIFLNLVQLTEADKFAQWAMRVVENEAKMYRRKRHQHLYESMDDEEEKEGQSKHYRPRQFADWRDLPNEILEQQEVRAAIIEAMTSLPEIYREVFMLRDMEHLNVAETAEILSIGVPAVKTRLHRARLMMREALSPIFAKPRISIWERWKGVNPWSAAKQ